MPKVRNVEAPATICGAPGVPEKPRTTAYHAGRTPASFCADHKDQFVLVRALRAKPIKLSIEGPNDEGVPGRIGADVTGASVAEERGYLAWFRIIFAPIGKFDRVWGPAAFGFGAVETV